MGPKVLANHFYDAWIPLYCHSKVFVFFAVKKHYPISAKDQQMTVSIFPTSVHIPLESAI